MPVQNKQQGAGETPAPAQTLAIEHALGPIQVLAGPGSGKTYLTIRRIRHLICHHGISPNKILVITFTKAAAAEMEERFMKLTQGAYRGVSFGTFHAVYFHILQKSGYGNGRLTPASMQDKWKYLKHVLNLYDIEDIDREMVGSLLKEISHWKNSGKKKQAQEESAGSYIMDERIHTYFPAICQEYCRIMQEEKKLDFDDMIGLCKELLEQDEELRRNWQRAFSYILVDEFQDISPLQYQVLKMLALPENNLFVVGDDDQSIYGFRGAGPDIMKQFLTDYPQAVQVVLDRNYRSTEHIVRAASVVIGDNQNRFVKQLQSQNPIGEKVGLRRFETKEDETKYLLFHLQQIPLGQLSETAIICRTNVALADWSRQLTTLRIPFCCRDKVENLFEYFIAEDFLAYLTFAHDFCNNGSGKRSDFLRIMNKPSRYIRRDALREEWVRGSELREYYRDKPYMLGSLDALFHCLRTLAKLRPYLAVDFLRKAMGYNIWLCEQVNRSEQKYRMERADEIQKTAIGFSTLEEWLAYIEAYGEMLMQEGRQKEEAGVRLLTMHSSKGLEFNTVFLPGVNAKNIPNRKAQLPEQIEEERRIFYVAMTRAKQRLEISYDKEPSPFLSNLTKSPYIEWKRDGS